MAGCATLTGFTMGCADVVGGLSELYLAEWCDVASVTEASGTISAITMEATEVFYQYELDRNNSSFTSEINRSQENGTTFYTQNLTFKLKNNSVATRNEVVELAKATLVAIVKDNNGNYYYLGQDSGLDLSAGSQTSGLAKGDMAGFEITLTGEESEAPKDVDSGVIATVI